MLRVHHICFILLQDHPWKCDFPDCGRRFKLKEYRDHHRKQHPCNFPYQQNSETTGVEGDETSAIDNRPSSDQLRHRLVKLTIRHKEQLMRAEELSRTYQDAFNDCFRALEHISTNFFGPHGRVHNVDRSNASLPAEYHQQAISVLLSKYMHLATNYEMVVSDTNGVNQLENASGVLLELQKDKHASKEPSPRAFTAGLFMERLHGTISNMSSSNLVEMGNIKSNKQNKYNRIPDGDEGTCLGNIPDIEIFDLNGEQNRSDRVNSSEILTVDTNLVSEIDEILVQTPASGTPTMYDIYKQLVQREGQQIDNNEEIEAAMIESVDYGRKKRSRGSVIISEPDIFVKRTAQSIGEQDGVEHTEEHTAAAAINSSLPQQGHSSSYTFHFVPTSPHPPSANVQNVMDWVSAWKSKQNSTSDTLQNG